MAQPTRILLALVAGLALGLASVGRGPDWVARSTSIAEPIGGLWLNALRMTIVPLVVSLLITGIAATAKAARAGKLAGRALVLFVVLLWTSALASALLTPLFLGFFPLPAESTAALRDALSVLDQVTAFGEGAVSAAKVRDVLGVVGDEVYAELLDIVPRGNRRVYDMRGVLDVVFDTPDWFEVQPKFGPAIICALAHLGGHPVAVVANQPKVLAGSIDADAADKAAHFIMVADSFHLPIVFLADNPGMLPGSRSEKSGVLRSGARMFAAQTAATTLKLHVTLRKGQAYRVGNMRITGNLSTQDQRWIRIGMVQPDLYWSRFCRAIPSIQGSVKTGRLPSAVPPPNSPTWMASARTGPRNSRA